MKQIILLFLAVSCIFAEKIEAKEIYKIDYKPESPEHYSAGVAAAMNSILPSSGFFYSQSYGWAIAELVLIGIGAGLLISGSEKSDAGNARCRQNGGGECYDGLDGLGEALIGTGFIGVGWIGGIIVAPILASKKNREMDTVFHSASSGSQPDTYGFKVALSF